MERVGDRARIIFGRCLAYGEGITFWPLREMVVAAANVLQDDSPEIAREKILACVGDDDVADRLASATGLSARQFPLHEIYWGARRFMQVLARERPVVAMIDDIHWAEPAFLDLLEHLLETIDEASVLLLATARHELLEERADWGERERSNRLVLQPLADSAAEQVVANLLGAAGLPDALLKRIVDAAEGNPLYVEQMLSMLIDSGAVREQGGEWVSARTDADIVVPPTIHALLEARLDKLERSERAAAEPASVIGLEFARTAVQSLAPPPLRERIEEQLQALSRKHFIRPAASTDAATRYRFDHHLVRDTVYNGLLKRARATMHTEFVKWADQVNAESDRGQEFEAILGYHLEQAYHYLGELGPIDEAGAAIGRDGADRLSSAGRRAFARGDMHAAATLFRRAVDLLAKQDHVRLALLPELGETLLELGDFADARAVLDEAVTEAARVGDARLKATSQLLRMRVRLYSGEPGEWSGEILRLADEAIPLLEGHGADSDLARAWRLVAFVHGVAGHYGMSGEAAVKSMTHARLAGDARLVARSAAGLSSSALLGPTPVLEAIEQCERVLTEGLSDRQAESKILCTLAQLRAMNGEFDEARALYRRGRELLRSLGQGVYAASTGLDIAQVEFLAGDLVTAERELQADYEFLAGAGESYFLPTMAALLSRLVRDQGRDMEALRLNESAETAAADDDVDTQALWRLIRAPIAARLGSTDKAEVLARSALEFSLKTDAPTLKADALTALAEVLSLARRRDEALEAIQQAIALYTEKGDRVSKARLENWARVLN
jgi:tetratricopeptide (TPR) repeat protein